MTLLVITHSIARMYGAKIVPKLPMKSTLRIQ